MFTKILIANRGEIALRIVRACKEMGITSVVAYSQADSHSLPVRFADEAVCVGPASPAKSYLNIPNLVSAALVTNCEAVHPGYGFLSENHYFAEICEKYGLVFIGPPAGVLERLEHKGEACRIMRQAGLPVVPGSDHLPRNLSEAKQEAEAVGYPVALKPASGGGGRGMRLVYSDRELASA